MVNILNIKWDGKYVSATLEFEGDENRTCIITVDCESREVVENTFGKMNSYIAHARRRLCELYEDGKRPKTAQSMWY